MTTQTTTAVSERALLLLEIIAKADPPTLNELITMIELPKATNTPVSDASRKIGFRAAYDRRQAIRNRISHDCTRDRRDAPFISACTATCDPLGLGERDWRDLQHYDARWSRADLFGPRRVRLAAADSSQDRITCAGPLHSERQAVLESCTTFVTTGTSSNASAAETYAAHHR